MQRAGGKERILGSVELAVLSEVLLAVGTCVVFFLVDVVVGALWIPFGVAQLVIFLEVLLWSPHLLGAVWVLLGGEWSDILWDEHLIVNHHVVNSGVHLVFEPSERHSQVVIWMDTDGQLSWNWIPRVFVHFPDRSIAEHHHGHFIVSAAWPQDLDFLSFRVRNDLATDVGLVCFVEHVDTAVYNQIGEVNLLVWSEAKLLNSESLTTGQAWNSSHDLLDVSALSAEVPWGTHVAVQLLDVLHCPWSVIRGNRARLSGWVDVAHVVDRSWWVAGKRLVLGVVVLSPSVKHS